MFIKDAWKIAKEFFLGEKSLFAWLAFIAMLGFEVAGVYLIVKLSYCSNKLYSSLQDYNLKLFISVFEEVGILVISYVIIFVIKLYTQLRLKLEWRTWMTDKYLNRWSQNCCYYGTKVLGLETDNPDQRIADDVRNFIENFISLTLGFFSSVITLVSFLGILWGLSGVIKLNLFGYNLNIYGHLVWLALLYTIVSTYIMHLLGKPLSNLLYQKEKVEADFRYNLIRLRDNAESIALFKAEGFEKENLFNKFKYIIANTKHIISKSIQLSAFINIYKNISNNLPILVMAPRYFSKEVKIGDMMQAVGAFASVQEAFAWIIDSYVTIANFKAETSRLTGFNQSIEEWEKAYSSKEKLEVESSGEKFGWQGIEVFLPNGESLIKSDKFYFEEGEFYLINGDSGAGKSTLIKAIAGIYPFTKGLINVPASKKTVFVPQKTYMPLGTLLEVVKYPLTTEIDKDFVKQLLNDFNLEHLKDNLDSTEDWGRVLSGGEQQKIAFIRTILQKPDIVFLDEATSALDYSNEKRAYSNLENYLPGATIISTGHKNTLEEYHGHKLIISDKKFELVEAIIPFGY